MVDRITAAPVTATERVSTARINAPAAQPLAPVTGVAEPTPASTAASTAASALQSLVGELAAKPPVDDGRVARIRSAIAAGTFPITPENVADRLIALKLNWIPHDPS